jgi:hypothetical protein
MVIRIAGIVPSADTSDQGAKVLAAIRAALRNRRSATICFEGLNTATSSFVNAGLVPLLDDMSFREFQSRVRVVNSTRQINDMIKRCLSQRHSPLAVA